MRTWLISVAGLIIFIGLALFVQHQIQNTSKQIDQAIKRIDVSLTHKHWDQALEKLQNIERRWKKTKSLWAMLLNHHEIDSIDQALVRTMKATQSKNYSEAQMELGSLQHFIRHIPEREKFNLVNVL
jgi:DNA-directed RNA polymerase specialized sigma subunit